MKLFKKIYCIAILIVTMSMTSFAGDMAGFNFLRTHVGARPAALAGAFVAIPGDVHSLYFNPAGIAAITGRETAITYLNHVLDFHSGFVGYAQPFGSYGTIGVGINYIDYGLFDETDRNGEKLGRTFGANSFVVNSALGQEVFKGVYAGISFKYIRSEIDQFTAQAYAFDFGAIYVVPFTDNLNIGVSVSNVGQATSAFIETKEKLPLLVSAGFSKRLAHLPLLINMVINKYSDADFYFGLGGEFSLAEGLFLRIGYNSTGIEQKVEGDLDQVAGGSVGFGYNWKNFSFDYSLSSLGEVGSLNRLSFSANF